MFGIAGNDWNGIKWPEMLEWLGIAGNGWKQQEMARNILKVMVWMDMAGNG